MVKKKKATRGSDLQSEDGLQLQFVEYEITSEPLYDRQYKRLPNQVKDAIVRLYQDSQIRPHQAIPELLALIKRYPKLAMLYNYLGIAYSNAGQLEKSEEVIRENYRHNPDYLFARLNYAELYRVQGDYEKIAEIFEHKFDLKLLYPHRKRFHISEVVNFMGLMGLYFFKTGEREAAESHYQILKEIAPGYPMTMLLRRELRPGCLARILRWMAAHAQTES